MNSLSWLLYFADVANSVSILGTIVLVLVGIGVGVAAIFGGILSMPDMDNDERTFGKAILSKVFQLGAGMVLVSLVLVAIPSKNTIMLIAASEFAGQVAQLDSTKQVAGEVGALTSDSIALLHKYVTEQLATTPAK